jgi:hypothetical protein
MGKHDHEGKRYFEVIVLDLQEKGYDEEMFFRSLSGKF